MRFLAFSAVFLWIVPVQASEDFIDTQFVQCTVRGVIAHKDQGAHTEKVISDSIERCASFREKFAYKAFRIESRKGLNKETMEELQDVENLLSKIARKEALIVLMDYKLSLKNQ